MNTNDFNLEFEYATSLYLIQTPISCSRSLTKPNQDTNTLVVEFR